MESLEKYKSPEMEIIPVEESDVITTSAIDGGDSPFDDENYYDDLGKII